MYNPVTVAQNIKSLAKSKEIPLKEMLAGCGLSKNTMSSMLSGGSMPKSDNLAKIADYLDCSVDYLLGRTDDFFSGQGASSVGLSDSEAALITLFKELNKEGQERLCQYADDLASSGKYIKGDSDRLVEAK